METKWCSKCGEVKDLNEFQKSKRHKGGINHICKRCKASYKATLNWEKNNREHVNKVAAIWNKNNREKRRGYELKARQNPTIKFKENRKRCAKIHRLNKDCIIRFDLIP